MRIKKILIPIISAIFLITVICVSLSAFTVKEVNVSFSTFVKQDGAQDIQESLNKYNGKNLLFIKTDRIINEIEEDPYFKVSSIKKDFPNVLKISIEERKEVFVIEYKNKEYFADCEGRILSKVKGDDYHNCLYVQFKNVDVEDITVGEKIESDDINVISTALDIVYKNANFGSVKTVLIEKVFDGDNHINLTFNTYSSVEIVVYKAERSGAEKTAKAFELYNQENNDYRKSNNKIIAHDLDGEEDFKVVWSE
ncbi:MAG: FtsQ-type POTRA domain-containing protein [Clostridia bacterium]|nr:FtsQ-type POTRA domain-containing protein [Clostridia bacterium]